LFFIIPKRASTKLIFIGTVGTVVRFAKYIFQRSNVFSDFIYRLCFYKNFRNYRENRLIVENDENVTSGNNLEKSFTDAELRKNYND